MSTSTSIQLVYCEIVASSRLFLFVAFIIGVMTTETDSCKHSQQYRLFTIILVICCGGCNWQWHETNLLCKIIIHIYTIYCLNLNSLILAFLWNKYISATIYFNMENYISWSFLTAVKKLDITTVARTNTRLLYVNFGESNIQYTNRHKRMKGSCSQII